MNGTTINAADGMMTTVGSTSLFSGDVTNGGNFTAGAMNLSGSLTNAGNVINLGTMSTLGVLNNTGTLTNSAILNTVITLNGGALTNTGTFSAASLTNSGTFNNFGIAIIGNFSNTGGYVGDPSTSQFQNVNIGAGGYICGTTGDLFKVTGNLQNFSTQNILWNTSSSELDFTGGGTHAFDLASRNGAGFANNFAWGTLAIDPGNIVDLGTGSGDALYVDFLQGLDISGNTITNIDEAPGLFIYCDAADNPSLNGDYTLTGGDELIAASAGAETPSHPRCCCSPAVWACSSPTEGGERSRDGFHCNFRLHLPCGSLLPSEAPSWSKRQPQ